MRRVGGLFLFAILAGFCIGLGGTVFLRLRDAFPGGNVVGALLFTIGLFTICTRGYALFTGKACYLFENPWPGYLLDLLIIWVGNLLGTMLIAGIETLTGIVGPESGINVTAAAMVDGKIPESVPPGHPVQHLHLHRRQWVCQEPPPVGEVPGPLPGSHGVHRLRHGA